MVDIFMESFDKEPNWIVLDLDATDDIIHGKQEGRFFHGYYGDYCYLPLYIFCEDFILCAKLRQSDIDASYGAKDEIEIDSVQVIGRNWWLRIDKKRLSFN